MVTFGISHQGFKRSSNQDRFLCRELENGPLLLSVADGMGGQAGGAVAAQSAIDVLVEFDPDYVPVEKGLEHLIREADGRIRRRAEKYKELEGMEMSKAALQYVAGRNLGLDGVVAQQGTASKSPRSPMRPARMW